MNDSQNFLITIQGPATVLDVLVHFTKQLEERSFSILDMYYLNCQSALFLLILLEFSGFTDKNSLRKELDKVAKKYQLDLLNSPVPEMTIVSPVHRYILTLLSQHPRTEFLTKLFHHLRERPLHITAVNPLDDEDLLVFENNPCRSVH